MVAILAVMAFPPLVFPHPSTNDAIWLAEVGPLFLLFELTAAIAVYFVFRGERGAIVRAGVGVFLVGSAVSLVVGLFAFGNLSNDRFAPLVFFPPTIALAGLTGIVVAVAAGHQHRPQLLLGTLYGAVFAAVFLLWTLLRGARAWLLAPYGFDLLLLLGAFSLGVVVLGTSPNAWANAGAVGRLIRGPRRTGDRRRSK